MKTLVYFASGCIRDEYEYLDFDRIILVDKCFKENKRPISNWISEDKVTCLGMDCLESIEFLKNMEVKIDCFVSLNEGLYEGGGSYAINSDMFLGYAMTLFRERYIHIMNKNYYHGSYHVTMDLPYKIEELMIDDQGYLNPSIFSKDEYHKDNAKVFKMTKLISESLEICLNPRIKIQVLHDSIWNYYDYLESIAISFSDQGQRDYFSRIPKVLNMNRISIDEIFTFCEKNSIMKIGFTPWGKGNYSSFIGKLKGYEGEYPKEILLFHLNKKDYQGLKVYAARQ